MDEETRKNRLSNRSSVTDDSRSGKRKFSKTKQPIEAVSDIALNTLEASGNERLSVKRFDSVPVDNQDRVDSKEDRSRRVSKTQFVSQDSRHDVERPPPEYYPREKPNPSQQLSYGNGLQASSSVHYISGHVNPAFAGTMANNRSTNHSIIMSNRVHQEQYWTLPCCRWHEWSRRERKLVYVIIAQMLIICVLVISFIVFVGKNGEIIINTPNKFEPPWKS